MATYPQWAKRTQAGKPPARLTWVCGPEHVLVEEVAAHLCDAVVRQGGAVTRFTAGESPESSIWDGVANFPAGGGPALVLVRDAQNLTQTGNLIWAAEHARGLRDANLYLLFLSTEDDFARDHYALAPHLAALQKSAAGQIIRCAPLNDADTIAWIQRHLDVDDALAWHIWQESGHDFAEARAVCSKAALFQGSVSALLIAELAASQRGSASFADALTAGDTKAALAAVPDAESLGAVIGLLASRLDTLATLREGLLKGMTAADLRTKLRLPPVVVVQWREAAAAYTPERVRYRRQVLAVADTSWRNGIRDGVAEYIAALW